MPLSFAAGTPAFDRLMDRWSRRGASHHPRVRRYSGPNFDET